MIGYSEKEIFEHKHLWIYESITRRIERLQGADYTLGEKPVRCHELARACGKIFPKYLSVRDGKYAHVDHSWLTFVHPKTRSWRTRFVVLDVYSVGQLPMVRLVDVHPSLLGDKHRALYEEGEKRKDIDKKMVATLLEKLGGVV